MSLTLHNTVLIAKKLYATKIAMANAIVIILLLAGCAELPLVANAGQAIAYAVVGAPDAEINRDAIQKLPFASISAKIGSGPRSLLVLGKHENGLKHWFSADQAVVVTRNGRIVQTSGFPENLKNTFSNQDDPVNRKLHSFDYGDDKRKLFHVRTIDIDKELRFGVPVRSSFEIIGPKLIEISGVKIKTILVKELNTAFSINWSFTNFYWVDKFDGFVWKSRQKIAKSFPPIDIEVLKPAL
jgi:hypothetical protein